MSDFDVNLFPDVPQEVRPRSVYFKVLLPLVREILQGKGYAPACLFELPRSTPEQEQAYLMAKCQGIEEGTIIASEEEVHALELEMKAYNMLAQKHIVMRFDAGTKQKHKSLDEVFGSWKNSRHTLRGNSTVETMQLPELRRKELTSGTGKRPKGDTAREKRKRRS